MRRNHRWERDGADVKCLKCGISIGVNVNPRRVTKCPPTWFEREIIELLWYGGVVGGGGFNGLQNRTIKIP